MVDEGSGSGTPAAAVIDVVKTYVFGSFALRVAAEIVIGIFETAGLAAVQAYVELLE